jgi:uncharacterized repeat protein (TIGR03803 family)
MRRKLILILPLLIAGLMLAGPLTAQTFTTLYNFTDVQSSTNTDGGYPVAGLVASGNTLYGTSTDGGTSQSGTVFSITTDETNFITLHDFSGGSDGATPYSSLILSGNKLYGTARDGGVAGYGTVFSLNTDGSGFVSLHGFSAPSSGTNGDGANPVGGLILSNNILYGTATMGGTSGYGTVFAINLNTTNFATLHSFTDGSDGAYPQAGLILSGGTLYGTAQNGGAANNGVVFALQINGSGFTNLHSFSKAALNSATQTFTNSDGTYPQGELVLSGNTLYGTAEEGGTGGNGTVFAVNTSGLDFATLHSFKAPSNPFGTGTNPDGGSPLAGLILLGNTLYGTAYSGGSSGYGTVFQINTGGSLFRTLHSFTAAGSSAMNIDGARPYGGLLLSGDALYGTTEDGGSGGNGTIFSVTIVPQLAITVSGSNVILMWPTNTTGFTLQATTSLLAPNWSTVSPGPVPINGQNTVTTSVSGPQMFYRLIQ